MKHLPALLIVLLLSLTTLSKLIAQDLESTIDKLLSEKYQPGEPGATALVARNGQVLYRKAFGLANLELGTPMRPENVFEIGSITKQFTAVSVLMLLEEDKLSLNDEITKYLPDYPTHGKTITIHHLLNHTSGIKSYTGMREFRTKARTDMTPVELIDFFKNEPMDFGPGDAYRYNNSAYIILGHIIEIVSGISYADFVESRIFKKLGMKNSLYGSKTKLIKNRAYGYQPAAEGYSNAEYLSMSLPYAGGSLMSCVDDMLLWQRALHNNILISEESKKLAFTNYTLNNGKAINYGYGFSVDEISGIPSIEHGGGIFGYETYGVYVPEEDVYVIILSNRNGNGPTDVTVEIAAHAMGKPLPSREAVSLSEEQMKKWLGTYQFSDDVLRYVTFEDGQMYSQREGSSKLKIYPVSANRFYFEGSTTNYTFSIKEGKKQALFGSRINREMGYESTKKQAAEKKSISLGASVLKRYVGTYALQPGFDIVITSEENQIFAQATGQPKFELYAEDETNFFLKAVNASIEFKLNDNGVYDSMVLTQGGQTIEGVRSK
ncbi:MAG: serine hydrolase [Bacteroidia bacterium]|nr:serine hydrolase [Bacteroidia bacterium]MBT8275334.1 serine hydrolase [Bacteroidia bacterium]NNJ82282.1 serine hydrolase [Flavobacteriaceae bacterium]NNK54996.1 serine hydrolase [Flavobacteriaceae bacterium]NNM09614.1 serine hydrolase [Flavobacteriaceae bacterium]